MAKPPAPPIDPKRGQTVLWDAIRHAVPLVPFYFRHGSLTSYLLLTAFDLSLGLMLIVATTRDRRDPTTVDPRATWLVSRLTAVVVLSIFLGVAAAIISVPIAMPAFIFASAAGVDWLAFFTKPGFWIPLGLMMLVTGFRAQQGFEAVTTPGELGTRPDAAPIVGDIEQDRRRSKAANAAQVTIIATYVGLCYLLSNFSGSVFYFFPLLFAALLVFYDARPDLAQQIFPQLWREEKKR